MLSLPFRLFRTAAAIRMRRRIASSKLFLNIQPLPHIICSLPRGWTGATMGQLSMATRKELTAAVSERYRASTRTEKARILDEFVVITGFHRKQAMRLLRCHGREPTGRRARPRVYDEAERNALILLWEASDRVCGKRLKALLPVLVEAMERHGHFNLAPEIRGKLLAMSAATIDRTLGPIREGLGPPRRRPAAHALRRSIPIRTSADWDNPAPGFVEADLVAHCGPSARGSGDRGNRCPSRGIFALVIQNHPHCSGAASGENLLVVLLISAPLSQKLEPPANPAWFNRTSDAVRSRLQEIYAGLDPILLLRDIRALQERLAALADTPPTMRADVVAQPIDLFLASGLPGRTELPGRRIARLRKPKEDGAVLTLVKATADLRS